MICIKGDGYHHIKDKICYFNLNLIEKETEDGIYFNV